MSERKLLDLPQHVNPSAARTASAPYNFVPLPEVVLKAVKSADDLPHHDSFANEGYPHSGYFEVTLTTRSPLYVRGMLSTVAKPGKKQSEFEQAEAEKMGQAAPNNDFHQAMKNKPEFFNIGNQAQPVIPGSSLRGMLRGLLEIVSYGKVQWVSKKQLFFRTVDNTAVGVHYRGRMVQERGGQRKTNVRAGFLQWQEGQYQIVTCRMLRIPRIADEDRPGPEIGTELYDGSGPMKTPRWDGEPHQYQPCWVQMSADDKRIARLAWQEPDEVAGWREGRLVITGDMPQKVAEFIFLLPDEKSEKIEVEEAVIEQFHDDDQISLWQQKAFPPNKPDKHSRERKGMLRKNLSGEGDPIFFLREPERNDKGEPILENGKPKLKVTFFGRARMFRLPYMKSPIDLVPDDLRKVDDIDFAEAMFGFVRTREEIEQMKPQPPQGSKARACAGRVFVTDARLSRSYAPGDLWLSAAPIVPRILASPKPTAFQHYLVQPSHEPDGTTAERARAKKALSHYDSPTAMKGEDGELPIVSEPAVIRGHKLYWHQGAQTAEALRAKHPGTGLGEDPNVEPQSARQFERGPDGQWRVKGSSTQYTQLKPVNSNVTFKFRVYFENLCDEELGALCWTLQPLGENADQDYCHSLGMGKPLGMGAVKLNATLHLMKREQRYAGLFEGDDWKRGVTNDQKQEMVEQLSDRTLLIRRVQPFEQCVLRDLKVSNQHLFEVKRIAMLLKMLAWPGYPPKRALDPDNRPLNTRYMSIQLPDSVEKDKRNEYKERPVLPDVTKFDATLEHKAAPKGEQPWLEFTEEDRLKLIAALDAESDESDSISSAASSSAPGVDLGDANIVITKSSDASRPKDIPLPEIRDEVSPEAEAILADSQKLAEEREAKEALKQKLKAEKESRQRGRRR